MLVFFHLSSRKKCACLAAGSQLQLFALFVWALLFPCFLLPLCTAHAISQCLPSVLPGLLGKESGLGTKLGREIQAQSIVTLFTEAESQNWNALVRSIMRRLRCLPTGKPNPKAEDGRGTIMRKETNGSMYMSLGRGLGLPV